MPKLYNQANDPYIEDAVYIGRPTKWGNPFVIGKDGNRPTVITKYEEWLRGQPELVEAVKRELNGKDLVCWCAPKACHGDVLMRIANERRQHERKDKVK